MMSEVSDRHSKRSKLLVPNLLGPSLPSWGILLIMILALLGPHLGILLLQG